MRLTASIIVLALISIMTGLQLSALAQADTLNFTISSQAEYDVCILSYKFTTDMLCAYGAINGLSHA